MGQKKAQTQKKSAKELKKELEDKTFGMKNKNKSSAIKKQLQKLEISASLERRKKNEQDIQKEKVLVQPKAPVGVDPKTIPCVYFQKKLCTKGDKCKYGHEIAKPDSTKDESLDNGKVCRFLVDAMNQGSYSRGWTCPDKCCRDVHMLSEIGARKDVEIGLEEYLELSRQNVRAHTPMTEELFLKWREKKLIEEQAHQNKVKQLSRMGRELFDARPEIFEDDEDDGDFIDYSGRYENSGEE
eukprot:jgi/Antlo1/2512/1708